MGSTSRRSAATLAELASLLEAEVLRSWLDRHPGWTILGLEPGEGRVRISLAGPGEKLVLAVEPAGAGKAAFKGRALAVSALEPPHSPAAFDALAREIAAVDVDCDAIASARRAGLVPSG